MGYNTDFFGSVEVDPPVDLFLATKLRDISASGDGIPDDGISDAPEYGWLQWILNEEGDEISWDGGEKFYDAAEWMKWLIDTHLAPAGHVCNGTIEARGDESDDHWFLIVENNQVYTQQGAVQPTGEREAV